MPTCPFYLLILCDTAPASLIMAHLTCAAWRRTGQHAWFYGPTNGHDVPHTWPDIIYNTETLPLPQTLTLMEWAQVVRIHNGKFTSYY